MRNILLFLIASARLQGQLSPSERIILLRGEIKSPEGRVNDIAVEFVECGRNQLSDRVPVAPDGAFEIRNIDGGCYHIRVIELVGHNIILQETVQINNHSGPLMLNLPRRKEELRLPGTVSYKQLVSPPPRDAVKAIRNAAKHSEAGGTGKAIEELERALRIHPSFVEAHVNLGVQLVRAHRLSEAQDHFEQARRLGNTSALLFTNLAYVQFELKDFAASEEMALEALAREPSYARAHYMLGNLMILRSAPVSQATEHLEIAGPEVPSAYLVIARLLRAGSDPEGAAAALRKYKKHCSGEERARVEGWIASLVPATKRR